MAATTESKDIKVVEIIDQIYKGDFQLPEFQREYVWRDINIKSLFQSVLCAHPIGTILILELNKENPLLAWNNFSGIIPDDNRMLGYVEKDKDPPQYLVLDGQQRLTSLCHITHGNSRHDWFLDLKNIKKCWEEWNTPKEKDAIRLWIEQQLDLTESIKKRTKVEDPLKFFRGTAKELPLSVLKDKNTFNSAIKDVRDNINEKIAERKYELKHFNKLKLTVTKDQLNISIVEEQKWSSFLGDLLPYLMDNYFDYKLPTVIVSKDMGITGVCKVFTNINTTGLKLGAFDLTVAVMYPKNISVKTMFDEVVDKYPLIKVLDLNAKRYLLQTLALMYDQSPKTSSLPAVLQANMFQDSWQEAVEYLNEACELLDDHCGSSLISGFDKYLCYSPFLPILACVIKQYPITMKDRELQILRQFKLRSWYFSSGISSRYSEGSDHKQVKDKAEMLQWFSSGSFEDGMPKWMHAIYGDINVSKSGAVGKTVVSLYNLLCAKDFYFDNKEVGAHIKECDLHHIFPKAALRKVIMKERDIKDRAYAEKILRSEFNIDSILNQTWLLSTTNRDIVRDRLPSEYLTDIINNYGGGENGKKKLQNILAGHCINAECLNALLNDDYFAFIAERKNVVRNELMTTGRVKNILDGENIEEDILEDESNLINVDN